MREHLVAHVIGDVLRNPGVQIALKNTDEIRSDDHTEAYDDQLDQNTEVASEQPLVNDAPGQDGRVDAAHRRDDDRKKHQDHLLPIRQQVAENTFEQGEGYLGFTGFFFIC